MPRPNYHLRKFTPPKSPERRQWALMQGCPTPYIKQQLPVVDDGTPTGYVPEVIYRLYVRRRGHMMYVQTHDKSPAFPGLNIPVHHSKSRWAVLNDAGYVLITLASRTPGRPEEQPRAMWNTGHAKYPEIETLVGTVAQYLPLLLNPKPGRPRNEPPQVGVPLPHGINGSSRAGSRVVRRNELLTAMSSIRAIIAPHLARATDGRRMGGYKVAEINVIRRALNEMDVIARTLRGDLYASTLIAPELTLEPSPAPERNTDRRVTPLDAAAIVAGFEDIFKDME